MFFTDEKKLEVLQEVQKQKCDACGSKDLRVQNWNEETEEAEVECFDCGLSHMVFESHDKLYFY